MLPGSLSAASLAALLPLDTDLPGRLAALDRYWRGWHGRSLPPDTRLTPQKRRRLRLMLQAIDGRTESASYREVAIALFGRERVAAEPWKTHSLRATVIGLVDGGDKMIHGGYRHLLHHRHHP